MKFFSELRLCYRPTVTAAEEESPAAETHVPLKSSRGRNRIARSRSRPWRPGLSAIAEDAVVSLAGKTAAPAADRRRKRSASSKVSSEVLMERLRDREGGQYQRPRASSSLTVSMPAFAPTPFMF